MIPPETGVQRVNGSGDSGPPPAADEAVWAFRRLVPSEHRREVAEILAEGIEAAAEVAPGSWALVHVPGTPRVALTIGGLPAVVLTPGRMELAVEESGGGGAPDGGGGPGAPERAAAAPGVRTVSGPPHEIASRFEELREAHLTAVRRAAAQRRLAPWRGLHRQALVRETERLIGRELPSPEYPPAAQDRAGRILALLYHDFPDWTGVGDPRFVEEETEYKRRSAAQARELLRAEVLHELIDAGRYDEVISRLETVGKATNLLFVGVPRQGDLAILYHPGLDKPAFCRAVQDLLHGPGDAADRLDAWARWVAQEGLPNRWTFPTYFLFLLRPESEIFMKPETTREFLDLAGSRIELPSQPSGEAYRRIRELAREVAGELAEFGVRDMVDVQSIMWVSATARKEQRKRLVAPERRDELAGLVERFASSYLRSEAGRRHAEAYGRAREAFRRNLEEILARREQGEDVTSEVLARLLPHADTEGNRQRGAWIHPASAVTKDVRKWFEAAGWARPEHWPEAAEAVLELFATCAEDPGRLEEACTRFAGTVPCKGFQAGMLSPGLNALHPEDLLIVNNKPIQVVGHFAGAKLTTDISRYPEANATVRQVVEELAPLLGGVPGLEDLAAADRFDAFCHWLVTEARFPFRHTRYWKITPGHHGELWEACRDGSFIALGWDEMGDISGLSKKEFEARAHELVATHEEWSLQDLEQLWKFARHIQEGDRVVATRGTSEVLGIGTVAGPYAFAEGREFPHRLPVEWEDTTPRRIDRPGWHRTLMELSREDFEEIVAAPAAEEEREEARVAEPEAIHAGGEVHPDALFRPRTFELLAMLDENPRVEVYGRHRDEFREFVEEPFRILFAKIARRLPAQMLAVMETQKRLFSRIRKNDYGLGGAWPFYWGAFYEKGARRNSSWQLFVGVNRSGLEFGFLIGDYAREAAERFQRNVARARHLLEEVLASELRGLEIVYGGGGPGAGGGAPNTTNDLHEWLENIPAMGARALMVWPPERAWSVSGDELAATIADVFQRLFPLVLLAIAEDPVAELGALVEPGAAEAEDEEETVEEYPLAECAADLGIDEGTLRQWLRALERKGQMVLYGPPGTGKTYVAEHLARHLVGGTDGFYEVVQFHPAYAYEDFIQGLRPQLLEDGTLTYTMVPGRFLEFCRRASRRSGRCVLIIDEINRANLSRVFGELMYLLEYRDREVPLAGGGRLRIPANVRVIGTMNTADRSIALVDHALRRRFAFVALRPQLEVLERFHRDRGFQVGGLVEVLRQLNREIADPNFEVGISFFLRDDLKDQIESIWRTEIEPYLEEYFFDRPATVDQFRWEKVKGRILGDG